MERHIFYINEKCRICRREAGKIRYNVTNYIKEVNYLYEADNVDITTDDCSVQSRSVCQKCYRVLKKCQDDMKYKKKNPKSKKEFNYSAPKYEENVLVHKTTGCECMEDIPAAAVENMAVVEDMAVGEDTVEFGEVGQTPSKVRKLSGDPVESPSDKLTVKEVRNKTPVRRHIRYSFQKAVIDFEANEIDLEEAALAKIYTAQDAFPKNRVCNMDVALFYLCRVCGRFPKEARFSRKCQHIYCKICIENYKANIDTTKCPPAFADDGVEEAREKECKLPGWL